VSDKQQIKQHLGGEVEKADERRLNDLGRGTEAGSSGDREGEESVGDGSLVFRGGEAASRPFSKSP
jgi:hypothetical protein